MAHRLLTTATAMTTSSNAMLDAALPVARAAAELVMTGFRAGVRIRHKTASDLVTEVDLASETLIRSRLQELFPEHAVVGEENGGDRGAELAWFVDPIDGTTNFAHGHPVFCVSIALVERGEPLVGIVIAPALGIEWTASRGHGARRNGELVHVSETRAVREALLGTGFPSTRASRPDNNYRRFLSLDAASRGVRRCGAAAVELAMVADGTYDGFWDIGLAAWDVSASALMVREAGGEVSAISGTPLDVHGGSILASNGHLHSTLVSALREPLPMPPGLVLEREHRDDLQGSSRMG